MFETNLRDERLLPFEGAGAESTWKLELPASFRQFDYSTISDVILHVRYTARQGGSQLRDKATEHLQQLLTEANASGLALVFSLPHDFPGEWHRFVAGTDPDDPDVKFTATVKRDHFPYFTLGMDITLTAVQYAKDDKLEFVTPQDLVNPQALQALTDKLKTDGACEILLTRDWVEDTINSGSAYGVSELVLSGFLRMVTPPQVLERPTPLAVALEVVKQIRSQLHAVPIRPGPRHWAMFEQLLRARAATGTLVPDAYHTALTIESGCDWITTDKRLLCITCYRLLGGVWLFQDDIKNKTISSTMRYPPAIVNNAHNARSRSVSPDQGPWSMCVRRS